MSQADANLASATAVPPDLLAIAQSIDAEINQPVAGTPEALELERKSASAAIPLEREIAGMFAMAAGAAGQWLPSVGQAMNAPDKEGKCAADRLGDALAPLARKYGFDRYLEGFAWRVELEALVVTVPIAIAIVQAAKLDLATLEARKRGASPAAANDRSAGDLGQVRVEASAPMLEPIERPQ